GRVALFHNEPDGKGGRRLVDVTAKAGLGKGITWATSAAWADLDGDGYPDLYVCQYVDWSWAKNPECIGFDGKRRDVCGPGHFNALPHRLFHNCRGAFREVGKAAGLRVEGPDKEYGKGLGVLALDVNGDGKPDLYVANDASDKFLYLNRSTPGAIRLEEVGLSCGVARDQSGQPNGSMGVAAADYDGCGRPSLWVTNYEGELHALYRNDSRDGRVAFQFSTQAAGIGIIGQKYVGWGTGFFDLDHDGREHLFITNGHPNYYPQAGARPAQRPVLLRNLGAGRFQPITAQGGPYFRQEHHGRGVAFGDLDNDGRTDVIISHQNEPVVVLRNEAPPKGHWLGVSLVGRGHRDVVGAKLTLEVGGRRLTRFAQGGGSYLSSSDRRHVFGLGESDKAGRLTVAWPGGKEEHWDGLAVDRYWPLAEGQGDKVTR
ncbi:MAG TPA: CRTAC1 family protein, partial [Gemmataceae bacterium]|nr:CRTAC1 family protein [Gemmataceae bacterium]